MDAKLQRNRQFLTDLFAGPFRGHAFIMDPQREPRPPMEDFYTSNRPISEWVPGIIQRYAFDLDWHEKVDDDHVPYASLGTSTALFASAFGCPVHVYEDSPSCALPIVSTAEEADRLPEPTLEAGPLARVFELGELVREQVGPGVPIGVPDIQSAFDIAALIWRKEDLFTALITNPDAVMRLVAKCHRVLKAFFHKFKEVFPECNLAHCPVAWAPPELGVWLSEDEAGSISVAMFERFCLPWLVDLSEEFGGLFVHCCAAADHQYNGFKKIPNLRGLNRVFQDPGPKPAIDAFSDTTVLMVAWTPEDRVYEMLDMALPNTRFLFNMSAQPLDEAKAMLERLRARCPRSDS